MATIKDIAKMAGVSITTVSRVLNNHPYVAEDKRKKVQNIIDELQYQQNTNAIHLVTGKTSTIGVILPYASVPYFQTLIDGITQEAFTHNYSIMLCPTNYNKEEEIKYLTMLKGKQFDGLIICSRANNWETVNPYSQYGTIVMCEYSEELPCVFSNTYSAFYSGMRYLLERGHKKIGYCTSRNKSMRSRMRYAAYKVALDEINEPVNSLWTFTERYTIEDGKQVIHDYLSLNEKPTALIVNGDEIAAGIIIEAKKQNIRIPEDLALIGFDNLAISEALELTTIDQSLTEIGKEAFKLCLSKEMKVVEMPYTIIERKSV